MTLYLSLSLFKPGKPRGISMDPKIPLAIAELIVALSEGILKFISKSSFKNSFGWNLWRMM